MRRASRRLRRFKSGLGKSGENVDRWMISYADFITLLFAFFVVLYAISQVNEGKYRVLSESLTEAFDSPPRSAEPVQEGDINRIKRDTLVELRTHSAGSDSSESPAADEQMQVNLRAMADDMQKAMQGLINNDLVAMRRSDDWLEIEISSSVLFPSGEADFSVNADPLLKRVAKILAPFPNPINVEGFTDNLPINNDTYPSNWELSAARAASVVHLFAGAGIDPKRMTAIGYGEYRPIADNNTEAGRAKNRRVVLAILAKDMNVRFKEALENADRRPQDGTGFPQLKTNDN